MARLSILMSLFITALTARTTSHMVKAERAWSQEYGERPKVNRQLTNIRTA
jgi:hypothetical protein